MATTMTEEEEEEEMIVVVNEEEKVEYKDPQNGYLDDIFDVLDTHQHPCIVMGRSALLWMGAGVLQSSVSVVYHSIAAFSGRWKSSSASIS
jgi:hypothetical protein